MIFLMLLCSYSICFGIQHKIPLLHEKSKFTDDLLSCTYCTGFHAGYITYSFFNLFEYIQKGEHSFLLGELFLYSFASAVFCYIIDVFVQHFEK